MCIYCGTDKYRKIYENHVGSIPTDSLGRSYHIHHKDGNRSNNHPGNLVALSVQDHYDVHLAQKDYAACALLATMLHYDQETISNLSRKCQLAKVAKGSHPWQKRGKDSFGYAHVIYEFENLQSGLIETLTQGEFAEKYNLSIYGINQLVHRRTKTIYGWKIRGTDHTPKSKKGKNNKGYDHTLFNFENINSGEIVTMTKCDFYTKYKLDANSVIQLTKMNGKNKTVDGWKMAGTNHFRGDIHTFENAKSGERVIMYQRQFIEDFNLNAGHVCQMIKQNPKYKTVKGWKLVK